jgi:hypothetical protein
LSEFKLLPQRYWPPEYLNHRFPQLVSISLITASSIRSSHLLLLLILFSFLRRSLHLSTKAQRSFNYSIHINDLHLTAIMRYYPAVLLAALVAHVSAHGVITSIQGANGVTMPGLSGEYPY